MLEITEHEAVEDYDDLVDALAPLRRLGARVAIDDAGAGFASLRHTLRIAPDIVKLDMSLTRDIDGDRAKRALAAALVSFASEMGFALVAEGIETAAELATVRELGVGYGQGFFLAEPGSARRRYSPLRRSIAHDEVSEPFVNCFISVATATASA